MIPVPQINWSQHMDGAGRIIALGAEVYIGGKRKRNAVAFWAVPTTEDLTAAREMLEKWAWKLQQQYFATYKELLE